jgi:chromosome segregation ATPase
VFSENVDLLTKQLTDAQEQCHAAERRKDELASKARTEADRAAKAEEKFAELETAHEDLRRRYGELVQAAAQVPQLENQRQQEQRRADDAAASLEKAVADLAERELTEAQLREEIGGYVQVIATLEAEVSENRELIAAVNAKAVAEESIRRLTGTA